MNAKKPNEMHIDNYISCTKAGDMDFHFAMDL